MQPLMMVWHVTVVMSDEVWHATVDHRTTLATQMAGQAQR